MSISGFSSSPSGLMRRREARRIAMTLVYAVECTGYPLDEVVNLVRTVREDWNDLPDFSKRLAYAVQRNDEEIESAIGDVLENWRLDRISPVERALLKLGCAEILYFSEIPPALPSTNILNWAKPSPTKTLHPSSTASWTNWFIKSANPTTSKNNPNY